MNFEKEIKPIVDVIAGRLGLKGPAYDTPEGRQRERTIRLMFRRGYISEAVARQRLQELQMPTRLIDAVIEHDLVEKRTTVSP